MIAKTQTLTVSGALNMARYITDAKHPHHQGKTILVGWLGAAFEGVAKRNREAKFRHEIESAIRPRHTGRPPTVACHHLILSGAPGDGPLRPEERKVFILEHVRANKTIACKAAIHYNPDTGRENIHLLMVNLTARGRALNSETGSSVRHVSVNVNDGLAAQFNRDRKLQSTKELRTVDDARKERNKARDLPTLAELYVTFATGHRHRPDSFNECLDEFLKRGQSEKIWTVTGRSGSTFSVKFRDSVRAKRYQIAQFQTAISNVLASTPGQADAPLATLPDVDAEFEELLARHPARPQQSTDLPQVDTTPPLPTHASADLGRLRAAMGHRGRP